VGNYFLPISFEKIDHDDPVPISRGKFLKIEGKSCYLDLKKKGEQHTNPNMLN